ILSFPTRRSSDLSDLRKINFIFFRRPQPPFYFPNLSMNTRIPSDCGVQRYGVFPSTQILSRYKSKKNFKYLKITGLIFRPERAHQPSTHPPAVCFGKSTQEGSFLGFFWCCLRLLYTKAGSKTELTKVKKGLNRAPGLFGVCLVPVSSRLGIRLNPVWVKQGINMVYTKCMGTSYIYKDNLLLAQNGFRLGILVLLNQAR